MSTQLEENARDAAEEARVLFRAKLYRGACSRAYYAMFNSARAMLATRGHQPEKTKTHKTVLRLFSLEFVKNGPYGAETGQMLRRAADARAVADYQGGVNAGEAAEVLAALEIFMRNMEETLSRSRG
jgi:uncharacterized protein (UPF0332 family)